MSRRGKSSPGAPRTAVEACDSMQGGLRWRGGGAGYAGEPAGAAARRASGQSVGEACSGGLSTSPLKFFQAKKRATPSQSRQRKRGAVAPPELADDDTTLMGACEFWGHLLPRFSCRPCLTVLPLPALFLAYHSYGRRHCEEARCLHRGGHQGLGGPLSQRSRCSHC